MKIYTTISILIIAATASFAFKKTTPEPPKEPTIQLTTTEPTQPPEKQYYVTVIVATDTTLTYKCNEVDIEKGFAEDCEDNEGKDVDMVYFQGYIVEIVDRQRESK